jgi:membrane associated rhomboid family serine protease
MKPFKPPTAHVTRVILIICVLIELTAVLLGPAFAQSFALAAGLVPARLTGDVIGLEGTVPAPLTLVTHMFLHGGLLHLAMNMVFLAWIGRQVEWLLGPVRLVMLFLLGGIVGGLLQVFMNPGSVIPIIGASGAISAVFATYALLFAKSGEAPASLLGIRISGETVLAMRYAALWIGLQLLTAVAFNMPGAGGGIAIWAHIGGFVAGLLFGLPLIRYRKGDEIP